MPSRGVASAVGANVRVVHTAALGAVRLITPAGPPWWHFASPLGLAGNLWRHRSLIAQLAGREFRGRYQGSALGVLWALVTPALMLVAYTFVFHTVLRGGWGGAAETPAAFALPLFAGLVLFHLFADVAGRAPGLIVGHPQFVKKVVFPLEVLPAATALAAAGHALGGGLVLALAAGCLLGPPGWQALWLPVLVLPYAGLVLGVGWLLAALGPFWRDLAPAVAIGLQGLMFLTPVFYPLRAVPAPWQGVLGLNPLAVYVETVRGVWFWGRGPDFTAWAFAAAASLTVMQVGYVVFMTRKRAFADVV